MKTTNLFILMTMLPLLAACSDRLSNHKVIKSTIGAPVSSLKMLKSLENPGPIVFEKILSMEQYTRRSEQVILADELGIKAGIEDADETISIYFYALRHPTKGLFLIDSGMPENYEDHFSFLAKQALKDMKFKMVQPTGHWVKNSADEPVKGVYLTHLHFDHTVGVADVAKDIPIYVGPADGSQRDFSNRILGNPTDSALKNHGPLRELVFTAYGNDVFDGILDIFEDGSLFAILTPGHTPGSLAFIVNSTEGPQLIIGDTVRTKLEWTHSLKPTWFAEGTEEEVAKSASQLRQLAASHPEITVHPGHQSLTKTDRY